MISYYREIDKEILHQIYENEDKLCREFSKIFQSKYEDFLSKHDIHTDIYVNRWIDKRARLPWKQYDGYSTLLCVEFKDSDNSVIELDENVFSLFEYITCIRYELFKRKYRVYIEDKLDKLEELWFDINKTIKLIEIFRIGN